MDNAEVSGLPYSVQRNYVQPLSAFLLWFFPTSDLTIYKV